MRAIPLRTAAAWLAAIAAFLVTRLVQLDWDLPPWDLAMYQPIDEFEYVLTAFNLHQYGTWVHQETAYTALEGAPTNVLQSAVAWVTLHLDWSYWGLRLSSVLLGLVAFVALLLTVRALVRNAVEDGVTLPFRTDWLVSAAALLLLADFSFLVSGRVVEPTIVRLAYVAVLVWLVARGSLLGPGHTLRRSLVVGLLGGAGVCFVYLYNAFLVPALLLAVGAWAYRRGWRAVAVHLAAYSAGVAIAVAGYFAAVHLVYGHGPREWYDMWVQLYRATGRADSIEVTQLWTILTGNIFRLDRPLMAATLLVLPAFALWTRRSGDRTGVLVLALLGAFFAQSVVQSDYAPRKLLILLPMVLPIAVGGLLRFGAWRAWVADRPIRTWAAAAWSVAAIAGTLLVVLPPEWIRWGAFVYRLGLPPADQVSYRVGIDGAVIAAGALLGTAALVAMLAAWQRPPAARAAGSVLLAAMLGPLLFLDAHHVFVNPTTAYRDAMIAVRPRVDGRVTAGDLSFAMQLYNTSRPVVQGYLYGTTVEAYEEALVRYCREHDVAATFGYTDEATVARLERLGFTLRETYAIPLPKGHAIGRYTFDPGAAPAP